MPNENTDVAVGTAPVSFDFERHGRDSAETYRRIRPLYDDFCQTVVRLLNDVCRAYASAIHSVVARAKDVESFYAKAIKPLETDPDKPKYRDPVKEITDLAGARIITYFLDTAPRLDQVIAEQFDVLERGDKATLLKDEEFGYQSIHYLLRLKPNRTILPEYQRFRDLRFELQVRTILQHAWAEIEHDIQYKSTEVIPREIRRRFKALAGVLELADREFQAIQHADEEIRKTSEREVEIDGDLAAVEITPFGLKAYLDRLLGPDGRMTEFSYDFEARNVRSLGFTNLQQLDDCFRGFNADQLNSVIYSTRQGQLSRFEYLLAAGMGENFIRRHRWKDEAWFITRTEGMLTKFREAAIPVRLYSPDLPSAGAS